MNRGPTRGSPSLYHAASVFLYSVRVDNVIVYLAYDLRHPVTLHYVFNINEEIKEEDRQLEECWSFKMGEIENIFRLYSPLQPEQILFRTKLQEFLAAECNLRNCLYSEISNTEVIK